VSAFLVAETMFEKVPVDIRIVKELQHFATVQIIRIGPVA
jgi:hypothetical protein